ncbi:MAG: sigma-54 dependent transcriptional regulator [Myxococcota bacterium]|nr:sigma-54-dependent Fis family transcriptional regulator [Deltaproteobacteria bacterium]MDQ3338289.1 sigma-54 dependent transcriptional regulator [Myxococcota bacterium]
MRRLLVIDDDPASCRLVAAIFKPEGVEVTSENDGTAGLARLATLKPDVVLLDLQMPGMDGIEVLRRIRTADPEIPVVMLTAERDVKTAVRAMQLGAFDYHNKPVNHDEILVTVNRAFETRALKHEVTELRKQIGQGGWLAAQMGRSVAIRRIVEQVTTVAATTFTVLLLGETGTGKELVAQAIHRQSERRSQPFVALDCGAIPAPLMESELFGHEKGAFTGADRKKRGQFALAGGGTVFLDEIGNLPMALQAKLLRVLEARQIQPLGGALATLIDVRFIAATNDDLQQLVSEGRFRADLYFRLAQYTVALPALRDRRDDIDFLARRFLEEVCIELRRPIQAIAPDAMAALEGYDWPGNARELRNVIRQAVLESKTAVLPKSAVRRFLGKSSKTSNTVGTRSLKETAAAAAREAEHQLICDTLRETGGNKSQAARVLQTDYKTLHVKMKAFGIRARDFMPS